MTDESSTPQASQYHFCSCRSLRFADGRLCSTFGVCRQGSEFSFDGGN